MTRPYKKNKGVQQRRAAMVAEYRAGGHVDDIADEYGYSRSYIYRLASEAGIERGHTRVHHPKRPTPKQLARIAEVEAREAVRLARIKEITDLYLSGKTIGDLAKMYHVSRERIRQITTKGGVTVRHYGMVGERLAKRKRKEADNKLITEAKKARRAWNASEVRRLYDEGKTYKEIMHLMGDKSLNWVQLYLKKTGGTTRQKLYGHKGAPRKFVVSDEERKRIGMRYAMHEDVAALAEEYGTSEHFIRMLATKQGCRRGAGPGVMKAFRQKLEKKI